MLNLASGIGGGVAIQALQFAVAAGTFFTFRVA